MHIMHTYGWSGFCCDCWAELWAKESSFFRWFFFTTRLQKSKHETMKQENARTSWQSNKHKQTILHYNMSFM